MYVHLSIRKQLQHRLFVRFSEASSDSDDMREARRAGSHPQLAARRGPPRVQLLTCSRPSGWSAAAAISSNSSPSKPIQAPPQGGAHFKSPRPVAAPWPPRRPRRQDAPPPPGSRTERRSSPTGAEAAREPPGAGPRRFTKFLFCSGRIGEPPGRPVSRKGRSGGRRNRPTGRPTQGR